MYTSRKMWNQNYVKRTGDKALHLTVANMTKQVSVQSFGQIPKPCQCSFALISFGIVRKRRNTITNVTVSFVEVYLANCLSSSVYCTGTAVGYKILSQSFNDVLHLIAVFAFLRSTLNNLWIIPSLRAASPYYSSNKRKTADREKEGESEKK